MTSSATSIRALLVYALILPLALILGYLLATPTDFGTWATLFMILVVICAPLVLAYHHPILFLSWNMTACVFFFPGRPQFWLVMAALSLGVSVLQRALSREARFISANSVTLPLLFLTAVVCLTAKLTGGFGLRMLGSENVGGKRYVAMFAAIIGFLAMIARPVPQEKRVRYLGLFFLGSASDALGSVLPFLGPQMYFLFLIFPIENVGAKIGDFGGGIGRLWGLGMGALGVFFYILAKYGVAGAFDLRRPLRVITSLAVILMAGFGGFRSFYILMALTFIILFYLEGLVRSKYMIALLVTTLLSGVLSVPFISKLPLSVQRTLSFLPLNVDPVARYDAQVSTEWRVQMWLQVLPEVPRHFWLGKGLGISNGDLEMAAEMANRGSLSSQDVAIMAGDYHSGPLSVIILFGIWGVIGFVWFLIASTRALYLNYRYGDENLKKINTFLLAYFVARTLSYLFVFGSFYTDLAMFCGIIGLNISLNGGIRQPVRVSAAAQSAGTKELEPPMGSVPAFGRTS